MTTAADATLQEPAFEVPPEDIWHVLLQHSIKRPDKLAFRDLGDGQEERGVVSFGDLAGFAKGLGNQLLSELPETGGRTAVIQYAPGIDYIIALLGCWSAGMTTVPAYLPRSARFSEKLASILADCEPDVIVTAPVHASRVSEVARENAPGAKLLDIAPQESREVENETSQVAAAQPALIQYTSGSTAAPKGVMVTHANLLHNIDAILGAIDVEIKVSVSWLPPYHDMGLISKLLLPIYAGIESVILSPFGFVQKPVRWLKAISDYGGSFSGAPNSAYDLCCRRISESDKRKLDLSSWKVAFSGSEPVEPRTLARFAENFEPCGFQPTAAWPVYGLAEATLCVTAPGESRLPVTATRNKRTLVSCGRAVSDMTVRIVDPETSSSVEDGEEGEIWISGPSVTAGYFQKDEATEETYGQRIADNNDERDYLRTGDLGFISDGELFITGRRKNVLIFNGENFHPEDLEGTLAACHPAVHPGHVAAFSYRAAPGGGERLGIAVEVHQKESGASTLADIARVFKEALGLHYDLHPATIVFVRERRIPRTTSGKLRRSECAALLEDGWDSALHLDTPERIAGGDGAQQPAPQALVTTVCTAMEDVFELRSISPTADFFELGGHSMTATMLASRLSSSLGVEVPIRLVFEASTPVALAAALAARIGKTTSPDTPETESAPTRAEVPEMTASQRRMWLQHVSDPESAAYNVGGALLVEGDFDASIAEGALRLLLRMHPILRATYSAVNGLPVQHIATPESVQLDNPLCDVSAEDDPEEAARSATNKLLAEPFDLENGPLYRFRIFRVDRSRYVFAVSFHHIVVDGWAVGILTKDFFRLYGDLLANGDQAGSALSESAHGLAAPVPVPLLDSQLDYWSGRLSGLPETLDLPVDHTPPLQGQGVAPGATSRFSIPSELVEELARVARVRRATPFMLLLTGFQILLSRYARQSDFVIAIPVANRNSQDSEGVITSLVNTLPYRADMRHVPTLDALIDEVREAVLAMQENQDVPLERIIEEVAGLRGDGAPFRVMFDYQEFPLPETGSLKVRTELWETHRGASQFDLSLFITELDGSYEASFEYRPALFEAGTIERMGDHLVNLLWQLVMAADSAGTGESCSTVMTVPVLTGDETGALVRDRNATVRDHGATRTLLEDFAHQVGERGGACAVASRAGQLDYRDLDAHSNRIARYLRSYNIGCGDTVAVYLDRSVELAAVLLGILKAGACYVPLDPDYPPERIAVILEDATPRAVVTQSHYADNLDGQLAFCIDDDELRDVLFALDDAPLDSGVTPESLAYVIFTSGSTGRPKGVEISHGALHNFLHSMAREPGFEPGDALLAVTTISFDISGLEFFLPLIRGGTLHIATRDESLDGPVLIEAIDTLDITHLQATPATWQLLLTSGWEGKRGGRPLRMLCGGEELPRALAAQLIELDGELWNLYGPTETTIWSTLKRIRSAEDISIGRPIDNTQCYVLDDRLTPVPQGVAGELFIGGDGVARGYRKRPDLDTERFLPDPFAQQPGARFYRTGDLVRYDARGELCYLGRLDHQVKIRGYRIELGEVASAIDSHPRVRHSVVSALDLPGIGKALVAYCELQEPETDSGAFTTDLVEFLRSRLPGYMVPTRIVCLDALPRTPNGKIDRKQLPAPEGDAGLDNVYVAPANELERRVCEIWEQVLGVTRVGTSDNFFALGGHSLLAAQAFVRMKDELGLALPVHLLFHAPTIAALLGLEETRARQEDLEVSLPRGIVPLHEPGSAAHGTTLVFVHTLGGGGGGGLLSYREIGRSLPSVRSYGIREAGERFETLEAMADHYAAQIDAMIAPRAPVALAGFCFGGNLAIEVARQLVARGREVVDVALLDARPVVRERAARRPRLSLGFIRRALAASPEERKRHSRRMVKRVAHALRRLIGRKGAQRQFVPALDDILDLSDYPPKYREIARHHWILLRLHEQKPYPHRVSLLWSTPAGTSQAAAKAAAGEWGAALPSTTFFPISGKHEEFLRSPEMLQQVTEVLRERLQITETSA